MTGLDARTRGPFAALPRAQAALVRLWLVHRRSVVFGASDSALWALAIIFAILLRREESLTEDFSLHVASLLLFVAVVQLGFGAAFGLYTGRWRLGSFEEAYALGLCLGTTSIGVVAANEALGRPIAMAATVDAAALAFVGLAGLRFSARVCSDRRAAEAPAGTASRVIVFGAGDGAARVISDMLLTPRCPYIPVALLDDDPTKSRLRIHGIPVRGNRSQLGRVVAASAADTLLIAIPSADAELIRDLADRADDLGVRVRVLPGLSELLDGAVGVEDIRPVSYADLLGRREAEIDIDAIAAYLTDKRVLVTGAGGSIGSELCRQLHRFAPQSLVLLDRDESALHAVQLSIEGRALLDSRDLVVADIRDRQRLRTVFEEHRPQVVFHAAALKHLPLLEMHPDEAVKTNVWGTWNVLEVAAEVGVERFVNISTDKAADPCSVLGYSKRIGERLTAWFSTRSGTGFLSVRFGNVLGSRGSVLITFEAQIATGGPVSVTHPDITRYFMTVEEAVRLVIQAGAIGGPGEALVLDMGQPVRIADVARRLIDDSGQDISIEFTGLRPGEKLHEALLAHDEPDLRPVHELISHVPVPPLSPADVRRLDPQLGGAALKELCREPGPAETDETKPALQRAIILDAFGPPAPRRRSSDPVSGH